MGLNDIQLNAAVLADLYPSSLVLADTVSLKNIPEAAPPVSTPVNEKPASDSWRHLGNNQKHILIIVDYKDQLHLPDEELAFLTTILSACKLSLGDVAIVNRNNNPEAVSKDFLARFVSKTVLLFGTEPAAFGLPVSFPQFQVQSVAGVSFLYAPVLEECKQDKLIKSKLWVSLQRIFTI